jgi:neutral amino acid transport system permease protein
VTCEDLVCKTAQAEHAHDGKPGAPQRVRSRRAALLVLALIVSVFLAGTASAQAESTTVGGTLRAPDGKPVAGVVITAAKGGKQVGKATTAKNGTWQISLPGTGNYTITLDVSSLPAGLRPARQGGQTLKDVPVPAGASRVVIFQLTTGSLAPSAAPSSAPTGGGNQNNFTSRLDQLAQLLVDGVKFGSIIAITAIGLSLIFGTTGLINFAQGELVTLGATIAFLLNASVLGPQLQLIPATIVTVVLGAMIGGGLELGLWRPLRRRGVGRIQLFIVSIGLSLVIRHIILIVFGSRPLPYADYTIQKALTWGPISIAPRDLVIIILSLLVLVGVGLMLQGTRTGKAIRAVADNRDLAESSGIDVSRVILNVWLLSGALSALGGVFFGLVQLVSWDMGFKLLLLMFAGVILGGLGTAYGVIAGSLVVGIVAQVSTIYFPIELQYAWALIVLILVLLVRPQGIFGRSERIG